MVDTTSLLLEATLAATYTNTVTTSPNGTSVTEGTGQEVSTVTSGTVITTATSAPTIELNEGRCNGVEWNITLEKRGDVDILGLKNFGLYDFKLPVAGGCIG